MSNEPDPKPETPPNDPQHAHQPEQGRITRPRPEYARQEPKPPEQSPTPPAFQGERRRIFYLALAGLFINGIAIPAILAGLTDPGAMVAFVIFQLIFQVVIWAILLPIGLGILRRRGYKTALVFMIVAIFVAGLPFLACMGLLGG